MKKVCYFTVLIFVSIVFNSCDSSENLAGPDEAAEPKTEVTTSAHKEAHPYGGWFCPDNFGFPPADIQNLASIPAIEDRLPTQEETRNGISLMYFDSTEYPEARPFEMDLPRVGKVYSRHNEMEELIIVIQAAIIANDTVVGYRFPSGGNGTAWFSDVTFLSDGEVVDLGPSPFVYLVQEMNGSSTDIWSAFCQTNYANILGKEFGQEAFFKSEWTGTSSAHLNYDNKKGRAAGIVANMYGNLYLHIDYESNGFQTTEKILLIENRETGKTEMHLAAGPYPIDIANKEAAWTALMTDIHKKSKRN